MFLIKLAFVLLLATLSSAFRPILTSRRSKASSLLYVTTETPVETPSELNERVINISPKAMEHILTLKLKSTGDMSLRMGVRAGGCSGMSYIMDMIPADQINEDDHIEIYQGIR